MPGSNLKVRPLNDRVVVRQDEKEEKTASGIYLPETASETPNWGTVLRVGEGRLSEDGTKHHPLTVKEGDKVIFGKYSGTKVKMGEEELLFMREEDIMAIVEA